MKKILIFFADIAKAIFWYLELLLPRSKNRWVFGAWFGEKYSDNSRSLYEYVLENNPEIRPLWLTRNSVVYEKLVKEGKPVAYCKSIKGILFALRAKVAFITVADHEVNGYYLHGAKFIRLWHGMPMKYIGADKNRFEGNIDIKRNSIKDIIYPYYRQQTDGVLITSEFFRPFFKSSFCVPDEAIWNDGYPRNDEFFSLKDEMISSEYRKQYPTATFIMYMPTHRVVGSSGFAFSPFDGFGFDAIRFEKILEKQNLVFFYKGHFFDNGAGVSLSNKRFINVKDEQIDSLYRFVRDMDVLITDYSSIYFDFLLTGKPIILAPFDIKDYVSTKRPLYFDYDDLEPEKVYNWNELFDLLENSEYSVPSKQEVQKYNQNCDGNSCCRIVKRLRDTLQI